MKDATQGNKRAIKVPRDCRSNISSPGANKVRKTGGQSSKIIGQDECVLIKKDEHSLPCSAADRTQMESSAVIGLHPLRELLPLTKIKLQLFPIDEGTRIGLEKDGHHPYLELTLRAKKKISSVLKRVNSKWGSSKVALGEPMLFPYDIHGDISGCRSWTMKDSDISARDVYASIGSPATFRLRYGWFSTSEPKTFEEPSTTSTSCNICLQSGDAKKDCNCDLKKGDNEEMQIVTCEEFKLINDDALRTDSQPGQPQSVAHWLDDLTNTSFGALLSDASLQAKFNSCEPKSTENGTCLQPDQINSNSKLLASWADCLTNISIGGLLSEVSLQGKFNNGAKSAGSNADLQSTPIISDSLDAFFSAQTGCPQGPKLPTHMAHSSILDAEETCHAFPVQRLSSSGKRVSAISGSSGGCSQDAGSKPSRSPKTDEIDSQARVLEDQVCQEARTDLVLASRTCNDESSLGLLGIKWNDSLGPFDLGLPASRKLVNGGSIK